METRNENESSSGIQKTKKRQRVKIRNQIIQQRDDKIPERIAIEDDIKKHEKKYEHT